jgi:hypothetical protein
VKLLDEMFHDTSSWPTDEQVRCYHIGIERDPVRHPHHYNTIVSLESHISLVSMQALDNFISPIPSFDGDIPFPAIPVLARPLGDESICDPSAGSSASASKARAGKRKATANPTPQKKAKKVTGKSLGGIKINEPTPKALASTPPSGLRPKIPIHRSKRYICHEYFSSLTIL